jgi:RNA polymerase sigma factor (sigma-70 family)
MEDVEIPDEELVRRAQAGGWTAVEELIRRHQTWVFNIAIRMLANREDAEDATQEILLKVMTKLSTFESRSAFRTWLHRIAVNHLLSMRESASERQRMTFTDMEGVMAAMPDRDLPDPNSVPVDLPLLVEEARISCMVGMLLCLDRRQRMAFTLGEVFGVTDRIGAELMDVTPANFRQILARARRDLYRFMNDTCGLVNTANPCRCARKTSSFIADGFVDPARLQFAADHVQQVHAQAPDRLAELRNLADRQHAVLYREHPLIPAPDQVQRLRQLLAEPRAQRVLDLSD